jgi:pSer/pThr/pTyr-binding forkhead associated (FHA) protein
VYKVDSMEERLCELTGSSFTVGRDPQADLCLPDPSVSWRHAVFEAAGEEWYVSDLGSLNGTSLNREQLPSKQKGLLAPGAEIRLGKTTFIFLSSFREGPASVSNRTRDGAEVEAPLAPVRVTLRAVPAFLVVREGPGAGDSISLEWLPVVIGGEDAPGIKGVNDPFVSTRHLEIERGQGGVLARDLGSSNGTKLNDRQLQGAPEVIEVGDELRLGPSTLLHVEAAAPSEPEPARKTWRAPVPTSVVVREGPGAGRAISLESLPVVVGGEDAPGISGIPDRFISTRHLEFERALDGVHVRDLGSSNGTRLNGVPLQARNPEMIQIGDELRLGPKTVLQVE